MFNAEGSSPPRGLLYHDIFKIVPVGFVPLCHPDLKAQAVQKQTLPGMEECDFGIFRCPASLCSSGDSGIFLPQASGSLGGDDAQHCVLLPPCQPTAHLLGNQPQAQVGLANIGCEDWFICKLGKDRQFLICTSWPQELQPNFFAVCFGKKKPKVLEDKSKGLL